MDATGTCTTTTEETMGQQLQSDGALLEYDNIDLRYNRGSASEVRALRNFSLRVEPGSFVTIVGSNGAGKSSLVQITSGAVTPTTGRLRMDGRDVTGVADFRRAGTVARVFDNPQVGTCPGLSLEDNLALAMARGRRRHFGFAVTGSRKREMRERLASLGLGLENRLTDRVGLFSAGQRQSVTLIMAALQSPRVLLLDEHLAALDPKTQERVLTLTVDLARATRATSLMVTHNMDHAITVGDRLLVMSRGAVVGDFSGEAKERLTVANLVSHMVRHGDAVADRMLLAEAS